MVTKDAYGSDWRVFSTKTNKVGLRNPQLIWVELGWIRLLAQWVVHTCFMLCKNLHFH